jgi:hypothetical protein
MIAQDFVDILGLGSLLAQLVLGIGAAMIAGNGYAIYQHSRGRAPRAATGEFRTARAWWLLGVGVVIAAWGGLSLLAG